MDTIQKRLYLKSLSFSENLFKLLTNMNDYQIIKDINANPKFNRCINLKALIIFLIKYHNNDPELISYLDEHINIQSEQRVYNLNIFLKNMIASDWIDKMNEMEFSMIITIIYNDMYELIKIYPNYSLGIKSFIINKLLDFCTSDKSMENKYEKISKTLNNIKVFIDNFSHIDINELNTEFLVKLINQLLGREKDILTHNYYSYLIRSLEKNKDKIIDYANIIENINELAEKNKKKAQPLISFFNNLFILINTTDKKNYNFIKKIVMNTIYYNIIIFCFETNYDIIKAGLMYLIESKICSTYPEFKQGCIDIIKYYDMHPELIIKKDNDTYNYCISADFIDEECTKNLDIYNYNNNFENKYLKTDLSFLLKEKVIKYKTKYLQLKKQFGGEINKSDHAYTLFREVYTDDNIKEHKKYVKDPFFESGGRINNLYSWYIEVNPEWHSMKDNNRPMTEYRHLIAGMIKDLYAKYIEYEKSGTDYHNPKKEQINKVLEKINHMITNNFIYREIIDCVIAYLTFFDSIIKYSCIDCNILNNLINSPFIIFPTFILYNFDKVILTMKAPFINFHLTYDQVKIHEQPSEPPSHQIGHDIDVHYNISTFNCIEKILNIESLDIKNNKKIYETLASLIELIKTYFNFMNITINKLQHLFKPINKDNLFVHTLFILLHEGNATGSSFIERAVELLERENNKVLQDFRKEESTKNLQLLFNEIILNFNKIATNIVDNLNQLVIDDMICYLYTKNLAMHCYETYSQGQKFTDTYKLGQNFTNDPKFKTDHQLPPDLDVKQYLITILKHNVFLIHTELNS